MSSTVSLPNHTFTGQSTAFTTWTIFTLSIESNRPEQLVKTQIRHHKMRRLIRIYIVGHSASSFPTDRSIGGSSVVVLFCLCTGISYMWRLFCHYISHISSFGALRKLCCVIVAFPGCLHLYFYKHQHFYIRICMVSSYGVRIFRVYKVFASFCRKCNMPINIFSMRIRWPLHYSYLVLWWWPGLSWW